jgi:general secretion pathway protein L
VETARPDLNRRKNMSRQILAIDLRNDSIVAVVLSAGLKSNIIEACVQVPLPDETTDDRLGRALTALREHEIPESASVVVSLPADRTIYRTVSMPFKEEKKIRQVLPFELEPNIPVGVDELIIDYQKSTDADDTDLLAMAINRQHLGNVMTAMTAANLRPQMVVPGDFPLALNLLTHASHVEEQALLLVVDTGRTTLFALKRGNIALVRSLASDTLSDAGIEALALKIRQTLTAFSDSDSDGYSPKTLYLSGPALSGKEVSARLAKSLDLAPQTVDLRSSAPKLDAATALDQWEACIFDGALGLALIEAEGRSCPNFHRSSSSFKKYWNTYRPYIRGPAVLLALVIFLSLTGVLLESHLLKKRVDRVNTEIEALFASTFPHVRRVGDALDQMKSELKKAKSSSIDPGHSAPHVRTIDILFQLSQLIPKNVDVVFSRLMLGNDGLTITGETAAFNVVDDLKNRLEKSDLFKQVTIASANMDKGGNKVHFKLKIEL